MIISELESLIKQNLYSQVLEQIEKDFSLCGLDFDQLRDNRADIFLGNLNRWVDLFLRDSPERLRMLLYRIDVSEKEITRLFEVNEGEIVNQLSALILLREIMKVRDRQHYK